MKKREKFYDDSNQLEECQTLLLIDRFKFMNLYPCDQRELKLLGYDDLANNYSSLASSLTALTNSIPNNTNLITSKDSNEEKESIKKENVSTKDINLSEQTIEKTLTNLTANYFSNKSNIKNITV